MNAQTRAAIMHAPHAAADDRPMFCPHDLLWVADWRALHASGALPPWAGAQWIARAPVVVRRERVDAAELVPVGVRGKTRDQRLASYLERGAVTQWISPEMLAREASWRRRPQLQGFPATLALDRIAPALDASGLRWGPAGSMGYALASGLPVLRTDSDLDLVVRCDTPLTAEQARLLQSALAGHGCRIDMQIDTGHGGFSFAEWNRAGGRVLIKTDAGPFMTTDPWNGTGWMDAPDENLYEDLR
jgi:phosphoribosyl-dephospho-CoA transferase